MNLTVLRLGELDYLAGMLVQQEHASNRKNGLIGDTLLLLEHTHVYTIGRRGSRKDILVSEAELIDSGISVFETDRGGEVTYHGPGQLIGYPIIDINPVGGPVRFVRLLENALIAVLAHFGLNATKVTGNTGVWIESDKRSARPGNNIKKIAAIGLKVSEGITTHGFALNVNTQLKYFENIIPCGSLETKMTSMANELGRELNIFEVGNEVVIAMADLLSNTSGLIKTSKRQEAPVVQP